MYTDYNAMFFAKKTPQHLFKSSNLSDQQLSPPQPSAEAARQNWESVALLRLRLGPLASMGSDFLRLGYFFTGNAWWRTLKPLSRTEYYDISIGIY